jgi:hypothetical protein
MLKQSINEPNVNPDWPIYGPRWYEAFELLDAISFKVNFHNF